MRIPFRLGHAVLISAALALALSLLIVSAAERALASPISCGDKITRDTTLHRDLVNCRSNGIVIGADGVRLDLNGHTIDGNGKLVASCQKKKIICDDGVVSVGHSDVTVVGGLIRNFALGAFVAAGGSQSALEFDGVGQPVPRNSPRQLREKRCPRQLSLPQRPQDRRGRNRPLPQPPKPSPPQLDPPQRRHRHDRRRVRAQQHPEEPVPRQPRSGNDHRSGPRSGEAQPSVSKRRWHHRLRQPQRDHPKPHLQRQRLRDLL